MKNHQLNNLSTDHVEFKRLCARLCDSFKQRDDVGADIAMRAFVCFKVFGIMVDLFRSDKEPFAVLNKGLAHTITLCAAAIDPTLQSDFLGESAPIDGSSVTCMRRSTEITEGKISELFSILWQDHDDEYYFERTLKNLIHRFLMNGIDIKDMVQGKIVLDAGCGSGKYACAFAQLGAGRVYAIDLNEHTLAFARSQAAKIADAEKKIEFIKSSIAHLVEISDNKFDFVYSNGVIHHMNEYDAAVAELYRVLKPGGKFYMYVNGELGLFGEIQNLLQDICSPVPSEFLKSYCHYAGISSGNAYWIVDYLKAPCDCRNAESIKDLLKNTGFRYISALYKGLDEDMVERAFTHNTPYKSLKFGDGKVRLLSTK